MKSILTFSLGVMCGIGMFLIALNWPQAESPLPVAVAPVAVAPPLAVASVVSPTPVAVAAAPAGATAPLGAPASDSATTPDLSAATMSGATTASGLTPSPISGSTSPALTGAMPATVQPQASSMLESGSERLLMPVEGIDASKLADTYNQARDAGRQHEAIDIIAPRGAKVMAVADGKLVKLFDSAKGGLTIYQFDKSEKVAYYYAHLDHYAAGLTEGMALKRGDVIGYVGTTGNANPATPHLHFAVFTLTPEKQWWKGSPVNPYPLLRD